MYKLTGGFYIYYDIYFDENHEDFTILPEMHLKDLRTLSRLLLLDERNPYFQAWKGEYPESNYRLFYGVETSFQKLSLMQPIVQILQSYAQLLSQLPQIEICNFYLFEPYS